MRRPLSPRRVAAAFAGAVGLVLLSALPASGHVTVSSPDAAPGGFGKLVFRVPNESDSATTIKVQVQLPTDTPFASVSTKPMPGWTIDAEPTKLPEPVDVNGATVTEAVTSVTWTAETAAGIAPEQFDEFEVSVGPFPEDVDAMSFPATQTYDDGEVVRWSQPVDPNASEAQEPEHPAPTLELATAGESGHVDSHGGSAEGSEAENTEPVASTSAASGTDTVARTLGGIAVVLAGGALVWSLVSGRRARG
jgi:periplasmic copper chaperone A